MEAQVIDADILFNISEYLGPPVVIRYQLQYLPLSGMSSNLYVMVQSHDLSIQVQGLGNINLFSKMVS